MSTKKQVYLWDGTRCKLEWVRENFPNLDIFGVETGMLIQNKVNLTSLNRNDFSMWVKLGQAIVSSENGTPILLSESDFEKYVMKEYGVYYVHDKALECIIKQQSGQDTKNNMMQPVQAPVIPKGEDNISIRRMPVYEWDGTPSKFLELKNAFPNMYINYYEGRATSSNKNLSLSESPSFHEVLKVGDKITSLFGKNPLKLTEDEVKYYVNKEDSSFYIYNNVLERIIQSRKEKSIILKDEKELTIQKGENVMPVKRIPVYEWDGNQLTFNSIKEQFPRLIMQGSSTNSDLLIHDNLNFGMAIKRGEKIIKSGTGYPILLTQYEVDRYLPSNSEDLFIHPNLFTAMLQERTHQRQDKNEHNLKKLYTELSEGKVEQVVVQNWSGANQDLIQLIFPNFDIKKVDHDLHLGLDNKYRFVIPFGKYVTKTPEGFPLVLSEKDFDEYVFHYVDLGYRIYSPHIQEILHPEINLNKEEPEIEEDVLSDETKKMAELLRKEFKEKDEINLPISKWVGSNKKSMEFMFPDAQIDIFFETLIITIEDKQYKFPRNTIVYADKDGNPKEMLEAELENVFMVQKDSFFYIVEDSVFV